MNVNSFRIAANAVKRFNADHLGLVQPSFPIAVCKCLNKTIIWCGRQPQKKTLHLRLEDNITFRLCVNLMTTILGLRRLHFQMLQLPEVAGHPGVIRNTHAHTRRLLCTKYHTQTVCRQTTCIQDRQSTQ